jgi:hypothetical protein
MAVDRVRAKANVGAGVEDFYMDKIGTDYVPVTKIMLGDDDVDGGFVSDTNPMPVDGTVSISGDVPVTGTFWQATQPVSGPLTDAELRASPIPISGTFEASADRTENLLAMLSRMVKLLESNAIVDQQQRQRITLDAIAASLTLAAVTTVTTVSTVSTVSSVTNMAANAGMDREQYINIAKQTYAASIRSRLEFV